ncbi:LytR/AlgR family response regulator transcription factor [Emticicia sp.]|uniref:LytR/AlgR family response regulator transcription factor n=1 Tax=Emticicia sp. TaxID=1930953 RepID=UPI0037523798
MKQSVITPSSSALDSLELKSSVIKLNYSNRLITIPTDKILRLEGDCNYTVVHTQNKKYVSARTLKYFEGILDKNYFVRVHKSHIINMLHIKDNGVQLNNSEIKFEEGKLIEVSRRKLKEVVKKFRSYNKV